MLEVAGRGPAGAIETGALAQRLAALRARYPESDPDTVADIVRAILETMAGDLSARETSLLTEVEELAGTIRAARAEIAAIQVDDITDNHIPSATDELDAIVSHTAAATDIILEVCETLDRVASGLQGDSAAALQDATTRIYEACSFQDITGQRITKVVSTLKSIDGKVAHMLAAFGGRTRAAGAPATPAPAAPPGDESHLLNGPQLPTAAMDQTDIDKLLASFD
jgi:chemotaxis protein CheZ